MSLSRIFPIGRRSSAVLPRRIPCPLQSRFVRQEKDQTQPTNRRGCRLTLSTAGVLFLALSGVTVLSGQKMDPVVPAQTSANRSGLSALPEIARAGISASMGREMSGYAAERFEDGFRMSRPGGGLNLAITSKAAEFISGSNTWSLSLNGIGRGSRLLPLSSAQPLGDVNRVNIERNGLSEWYVNGPLGVEQGFTIATSPAGVQSQPLTLRMSLSGTLEPSLDPDQRGITLRKQGNVVLQYGGLRVKDANGRELSARMTLDSNQLRIVVDDNGAQYPITIDPMVQAAKLTNDILCQIDAPCDTGQADDVFGESAAISSDGNTVVIGAPGVTSNGMSVGAAYVFQKPSKGWSGCIFITCYQYVAKLTPSDANFSPWAFGDSVAVSSDGTTVAVGAPGDSIITLGHLYVYARPSSGWTSMNQTAELTAAEVDGNSPRGLGNSVAISLDGSTIAASGTYGSSDFGFVNKDWIFLRPSGGWANENETTSVLGGSLALSGDGNTLAVETDQAPEVNQPGVDIYLKPSTGWANLVSRTATLTPSFTATLGSALGISNDGTVIAATGNNTQNTGAIYVFVEPIVVRCILGTCFRFRAWSNGTERAQLTASDGNIGGPVAVSGNGNEIAAVGGNPRVPSSGGVYMFLEPSTGWQSKTETAKVQNSDQESGDTAAGAKAVALNSDGTVMVEGSPGVSVGGNFDQGAGYVFTGSPAIPRASISPSSLSFGNQTAGTTSSSQTVTLTNTGDLPLNISAVSAAGPFTVTQNCLTASPIASGASCSENVAFAPTSAGNLIGSLTFTDDSGGTAGATQSIQLSGTGVKASTSTAINSVGPNPALVGQQVTITYTVTPSAGNSLTPSGTVTVAANTGESCTGAAPTGSCTITFASASNRTLTATYGGDGAFSSSTSVSVAERVVDFALSSNPTAQTISGKKATYTLTVTSVNGFAGTVAVACSGGPAGTTCAINPTSLTLGTSANATATLTLPKTAASGAYTVTFTGTSSGVTRTITAGLTVK